MQKAFKEEARENKKQLGLLKMKKAS